ncbi:MAG: rhodanese-like domain-containing protein [bacterium]|nr:rhodanese-like domain-containing protein [bacterium]
MMKKIWVQMIIILVVSFAFGLAYNQFSKTPLPVFEKYKVDTTTDRETGEDLSIYYQEMDGETLDSLKETDTIVLFDARTPDRYQKGHIPGAVSLPIIKFAETYDSVSHLMEEGKTIVLYCIDIHCMDSSLLAKELHKKGHQEIFIFKGGMGEWRKSGYMVQTPEGIVPGTPTEEDLNHEDHNH